MPENGRSQGDLRQRVAAAMNRDAHIYNPPICPRRAAICVWVIDRFIAYGRKPQKELEPAEDGGSEQWLAIGYWLLEKWSRWRGREYEGGARKGGNREGSRSAGIAPKASIIKCHIARSSPLVTNAWTSGVG